MGILEMLVTTVSINIMSLSNQRAKLALISLLLASTAIAGFTSKTFAAAGDLFVSDLATNSILVYHPDGTKFTFASGLNLPFGLGFDAFGNLYEADFGSNNIFKFAADGTRTVYASGLLRPAGLAFTEDRSDFFVAEFVGNKIDKIDIADGSKKAFASVTAPLGLSFDNPSIFIANQSSELRATDLGDMPTAISSGDNSRSVTVDGKDIVYASSNSGTIVKILLDGTKTTFASGLSGPSGMEFERATGHLFVAERFGGGRITEITPNGLTKTTFATGGSPNFLTFQPALAGKLANISTRGRVLTGPNVLIGGFIIPGTTSKRVLLRAIGPSLANATPPIPGSLADPVLELHRPDGTTITNDNWKSTQQTQIQGTGLAPNSDFEAAILATLSPGAYTAILHGRNNGIGVALVEVYDLDSTSVASELANISTRGFADTGDNVLIAGFIINSAAADGARVLVRAIGPSLSQATPPVAGALADPTLEIHDTNGMTIFNDNWMDDHPAAIQATGLAPTSLRESAILVNLVPGPYTAIVRGKNDTAGVALVEVYHVP